jgi:predicted RND superfamily exporter protein
VIRIARVLAFADRRARPVLVTTAILSLVAALICTQITFDTDILNLLPGNSPSLREFKGYLRHFSGADQLYIVFEVGDDARVDDVSDVIERYVDRLHESDEIARVDAGLFDAEKDWSYLRDRTFMLLGPAATRQALQRFEPEGMRAGLARSRDMLETPAPAIRRLVQSDPLGLLGLLREHFAANRALAGFTGGEDGYISMDRRSRLIVVTPTGPPFDNAFCRRLFARLESIESEVTQNATGKTGGDSRLKISYAGGHRIAFETESILKQEASLNTITSMLAILLFLVAIFRSPWLFLVGAIPMAVATLSAVAISGLIHERLSAATTGTAALLFGLGIDGLVLMYARYLEQIESGSDPQSAIRHLDGAASSMLLGFLTTAATFFGLTWIDLPALQQLGRLVGIGMLLGGPLTMLLVPAMLPKRARPSRALSLTRLPPLVRRSRLAILFLAAVLTVIAIPLLPKLDLDLRVQRLQPATPAVQLQADLPKRFGVDREVGIAVADGVDLEALLIADRALTDRLKTTDALAMSGPSQLLPPAQEQIETGRVLKALAANVPALQQQLRAAAAEAGFRAGAIDQFIAVMPQLLDPDQRVTYEGYAQHGLKDLIARFVAPDGRRIATAAYIEIPSPADLARIEGVVAAAGSAVTLTGIPIVNAVLADQFRRQFVLGLAAGTVMVFALVFVSFRRFDLTLIAVSPTLLGLIWAGALLAQFGPSLDLFSVFAVLMLIGVGVDYGIHLVHRTAHDPNELDTALARVAPANLVAAGIAMLGCGSLVTSSYPPLRTLGLVTLLGLGTCLLSAIFVLPALLMGVRRSDGTIPPSAAHVASERH